MSVLQDPSNCDDSEAPSADSLREQLAQLDQSGAAYATRFVDLLLAAARKVGASDIHLQPTGDGLDVRWRLDGVLQSLGRFPAGEAADVIARIKVLAELLTYRNDLPQEGRLRDAAHAVETRVSTFPTLHGERAVLRLFAATRRFGYLDQLGLPDDILLTTQNLLAETSGALLVTGPAGSGKTTTAYACLRELVRAAGGQKSVVSLEDPIEMELEGVAQSQVNPATGFDLAMGLRSLMRQDPEVVLVGEIRDRATAETVFATALTGHLVITTFHATSAAGAISRLCDMDIEPYLLRSGVLAILNQRLVRRLCSCALQSDDPQVRLALPVETFFTAVGCDRCHGSGYRGRMLLSEILAPQRNELGRAILSRSDSDHLEQLAISGGMLTRWQRGIEAVQSGLTSPEEIRRVLGFGFSGSDI